MSDTVILVSDPFTGGGNNGTNIYSGLPLPTLQGYLNDGLAALHKLTIGSKEAVVSYGEGQGQKSVTFTRANEASLRNHIREIRIAMGLQPRRSAIPVGM